MRTGIVHARTSGRGVRYPNPPSIRMLGTSLSGADGYLIKPVAPTELVATLNATMRTLIERRA
jgi:hypothetical protein